MQNERSTEKTLRALGLCAKARRLICGTPMICDALRGAKKPFLVISASDNADNTSKKLTDKCAFYETRLVTIDASGEILAAAVGKTGVLASVAVTDGNLAELVKKSLGDEE